MIAPDSWRAAVEARLRSTGWKGSGDELTGSCIEPAHKDSNPSANWSVSKGTGTCHGCGAAWSCLEAADLLGLDLPTERPPERAWEIRDAAGAVVAVHHRQDLPGGKRIWWSRPGGLSGLGGMRAADLPLYGSHLLRPREPGEDDPIFVCEGEPATDALLELDLPALGTVTGANGTPGPKALGVVLQRRVVCWPDADEPGRQHMRRIARALAGIAAEVRIWEPAGLPPGGDTVEYLAAHGRDVVQLIDAAEAEAREVGGEEEPEPDPDRERTAWTLAELLADPAAYELPAPAIPRLAWPGRVTLLAAPEKLGKSTLTTAAAAAMSRGELWLGSATTAGSVLWATEEHVMDVARRMHDFGADPEAVIVMQWQADPIAEIRAEVEARRPALVVIDTLAAIAEHARPESGSASQWSAIMRPLVRMARECEVALLILHHSRRADGQYRDSSEIGAAVDVIAEMNGIVTGTTRRITYRGRYGRGTYSVKLMGRHYVLVTEQEAGDLREEVYRYVAAHPECSQRTVEAGVEGRASEIRAALSELLQAERIEDANADSKTRQRAYRVRPTSGRTTDSASGASRASGQWDTGSDAPRDAVDGRASQSHPRMGRTPDASTTPDEPNERMPW
jgi:hypothetical protein